MQWPKDNQAALTAFYGDPGTTNHDLVVWESANLVYVPFPWKAVLAWDPKIAVPAIRCHRKIAEPLFRALHDVWANVAKESQAEIEKMGVHKFGGWYQARLIRGGQRRSTHGYGCAGDWNPAENKMFHPGHIDPRFRACFEKEGAIWLSHDPMHVQWAMSPKAMPPVSAASPPKAPLSGEIKSPAAISAPLNPFIANDATLALIKPAEKFMPKEYPDMGVPAIGYGHRILPGEAFTEITEAQATEILLKDLAKTWAWLSPCITVKLNPNQIGALLAFGMNNKPANVKTSTLLKKLNAGDFNGAADQFLRWNKGEGKVLGGLVKRRADERALFLS